MQLDSLTCGMDILSAEVVKAVVLRGVSSAEEIFKCAALDKKIITSKRYQETKCQRIRRLAREKAPLRS